MMKELMRIANHYGYVPQSRQLIEEMAELTVAINKQWRKSKGYLPEPCEIDNIVEEIADVEVMLEQIKYLLDCHVEVIKTKREKIARQIARIEEEVR